MFRNLCCWGTTGGAGCLGDDFLGGGGGGGEPAADHFDLDYLDLDLYKSRKVSTLLSGGKKKVLHNPITCFKILIFFHFSCHVFVFVTVIGRLFWYVCYNSFACVFQKF